MRRTMLLAILIVPVLAACTTAPPPRIARGLRGDTTLRSYPEWDQRVRERFPVGSDESALLAELRRDRFVLDPTRPGHANYQQPNFVCRQDWGIRWTAQDGRITDIAGEHTATCL